MGVVVRGVWRLYKRHLCKAARPRNVAQMVAPTINEQTQAKRIDHSCAFVGLGLSCGNGQEMYKRCNVAAGQMYKPLAPPGRRRSSAKTRAGIRRHSERRTEGRRSSA